MSDFPRANYGPREEPRRCVECGNEHTRVVKTEVMGDTKYRLRRCAACQITFHTSEKRCRAT